MTKLKDDATDYAHGVSRGMSALTLGAPVDILATAMRAIGVPIPEAPVGGSNWIGGKLEGYGLLRPQTGSAPETAGQLSSGLLLNPNVLGLLGRIPESLARNAFGSPVAGSPKAQVGAIGPAAKKPLIISSQRYLDEDTVARKMADKDFEVTLSPVFEADGRRMQVVMDGHHALEAAKRAKAAPQYVVQNATENDRVALLNRGKVDDFLEAAYHDAPWYEVASGRNLW